MSSPPPLLYPPPPFLPIATADQQPGFFFNGDQLGSATTSPSPSSSSSSSASVITDIIIIGSAIIISASIYLVLRFLSRRFHRHFRTFSAADDVVSSNNINFHERGHVMRGDLFDSLPVFVFGSVTGNISGSDCAVCLSKFETQDQLRLLPLCCHAFHVACIDTWLTANHTCPLCRSTVYPTEADVQNKIVLDRNHSYRIEMGSVSRRESAHSEGQRSFSIGSFEYIVDDAYEVSMGSTHRRGASECTDKDSMGAPATQPEPPGVSLAAEVAGGRSRLRDYMERIATISSRSVRSSGRFFSGSSRRSDPVAAVDDLEANRIGIEISELFRWFSGA